MSFEVRSKDLLGRTGILHTKHGPVETPFLFPVVNPNAQVISPKDLRDKIGFEALITNAYLVWRRYRGESDIPKIHELLGFDGVIETDSGAYQILQYGDVEVQPAEIVRFQERLDSDIAIILDVPTGQEVSRDRAKWTVDETIRRADEALRVVTRKDILWVGPVQGGVYPELVAHSAREMAKRDFAIHALGSPTIVMQQYRFDLLVDMIMAAKLNLPPHRPLHLFGAGHPMMLALAVALGCDIFDSASYALFARKGRYMTTQGTAKLEDLEYFPCNCPACHETDPSEIRKLLLTDRERFLASHNLYSCFTESQAIKQAISDGRLWELVEARSRNHPALERAFKRMLRYAKSLETDTPIAKRKGPFVTSPESLSRPEIIRYEERLLERYAPPSAARSVLLLPEEFMKPFMKDLSRDDFLRSIEARRYVHICSYGQVFPIIPNELFDVYPLSQTEDALSLTETVVNRALKLMTSYLRKANYRNCVMVAHEPWQQRMGRAIQKRFRRRIAVRVLNVSDFDEEAYQQIRRSLRPKNRFQRIS